ncbi:hypothetical protein BYZ73_01735 [Rhodovulum viride]|uniref:RNA polymerase sigma factor (Sigma-70 family) n=1 Tax=Rhodovulum viride TaxID=1231134 RepID=A0ABX9DKJ8_9RHOB|nr:sigma factor-like helix-turn-helix DNA-binding protein [Rhodovulum viride]RAP42927.1 hypothetical protein BYZ73_01735 [Rhodovulum viride]
MELDEPLIGDEGDSAKAVLRARDLSRALQRLTPELRAVVELTYFNGYLCTDIAGILGCPLGTAKTRRMTARKRLRAMLFEDAQTIPESSVHDALKTPSDDRHKAVWDNTPWYVNGSLPGPEAEAVRNHTRICPACAAELARQFDLASEVAGTAPSEVPLSRSWDDLRARIEADSRARRPREGWGGRRRGVREAMALAGTTAAACLVAAVALGPSDDGFPTLTSDGGAPTTRFQTVPDLKAESLRAVLARQDLTLV